MPLIRIRIRTPFPIRLRIVAMIALLFACSSQAQQNPAQSQSQPANAPVRLTLQDALNRARAIDVAYQATLTQSGLTHQDKKQALDALLPTVTYSNSAIYTQGGGVDGSPVKFIANNAVHEYISQGNVHEALDFAAISDLRRAGAAAAAARARVEIASRGLVVTVMQNYFATLAAQQKLESSQRASDEGDRFLKITQDLEHGGEVAHSDVIKAELQSNDRRRQLQEARLAVLNTRLDLSVLVFPDFNGNFELADDLHAAVPLPTLPEVQQRAAQDNPDIRAALETVKEAGHEVTASRAAYLPSLSVDYFYGIDAARFATRTDGVSNLGSSVVASVNIPIWNWGATQSRVKQAELVRDQAKRELSLSQRKLLAELQSLYAEADTAASELASLSRSADLAKESVRLTTLRYRDGEATVLEVVDAQTTTASADAAFQDGAVRYRVALANLQTLTGTLTTP